MEAGSAGSLIFCKQMKGYALFGAIATQLRTSSWVPALVALGFATRFIHYLLDRSVYRMRDPQVRAAAWGLVRNASKICRRI
jgi:hypothetical protein